MPERGPIESTERRGLIGTALVALTGLLTGTKEVAAGHAANSPRPVQIGRRVVTGTDAQGRSCIETEAPIPKSAAWNEDGARGFDFWVVRQIPASPDSALEPAADWRPANSAPPGGIVGRLITWSPGLEYEMHTTPTIDFGIIVSGQLELILDTGSTILNPGDVVVQRGTAHGWRVVGPEPCTWVVVMIDAQHRS